MITIIVLLILATVSISLVINSGIITKSKSAIDKYGNEEEKEQIQLGYNEYKMKLYLKENNVTLNIAGATVTDNYVNGWTIIFNRSQYVYKLSKDGDIDNLDRLVLSKEKISIDYKMEEQIRKK